MKSNKQKLRPIYLQVYWSQAKMNMACHSMKLQSLQLVADVQMEVISRTSQEKNVSNINDDRADIFLLQIFVASVLPSISVSVSRRSVHFRVIVLAQ